MRRRNWILTRMPTITGRSGSPKIGSCAATRKTISGRWGRPALVVPARRYTSICAARMSGKSWMESHWSMKAIRRSSKSGTMCSWNSTARPMVHWSHCRRNTWTPAWASSDFAWRCRGRLPTTIPTCSCRPSALSRKPQE